MLMEYQFLVKLGPNHLVWLELDGIKRKSNTLIDTDADELVHCIRNIILHLFGHFFCWDMTGMLMFSYTVQLKISTHTT